MILSKLGRLILYGKEEELQLEKISNALEEILKSINLINKIFKKCLNTESYDHSILSKNVRYLLWILSKIVNIQFSASQHKVL